MEVLMRVLAIISLVPLLGLTNVVHAAGIRCPEGMTAMDIQLEVDETKFEPFPHIRSTSRINPDGFVYLQVNTSKQGQIPTPIDAGGQHRGCVQVSTQGEVALVLNGDVLHGGINMDLRMWTLNINTSTGDVEMVDALRFDVQKGNWNRSEPFVATPFSGVKITLKDVSK